MRGGEMSLLIRVLIAAVVALVVYFVLTALIAFPHSALIFGLIAAVLFLGIAFEPQARRRLW